ncbi:MAG: M16 family metallopeptidase [Candidatus Electrothrix sp. YB6]
MHQQRTRFLFICLCFFLLPALGLTGTGQAKDTATPPENCISEGWPHEQSDLKPDPSLIFGTLKNGLRYVIMPNHEPKNRVALFLNIQAGAIHETEEQNGVAHYLEHMLFNGTTNYPPGTLIEYFQSIGMGFGSDTNAHTTYDETVYKLLLPDGKPKTLHEGMQVLADYAAGALLLEDEVDRERGIIQAEKRTGDSASKRMFKHSMKTSFAGTVIARHDVIGMDEVIGNADAALLRQYYERWYRPDNMIVVIVGDADPGLIEEVIKKYFNGLAVKTPSPDCPEFGRVAEKGTEPVYFHEKDLGYTNISIDSIWNAVPPRPTRTQALLELREYVAEVIMDNRLQQLISRPDSQMTGAYFSSGRFVRRFGYTAIGARTAAENWQQTLTGLTTALRQAQEFGFSESELSRAKNEIMTRLKKDVQTADSRKSENLVYRIIRSLNDDEVILSPTQELVLLGPALEELTLAEVNRTFRELWHERLLIKVMGTAEPTGPKGDSKDTAPEAVILKAFNTALQAELQPWVQDKEAAFPYLPKPETQGKVAEHSAYKEIGVDRYVFSNGLVLNLKQTDFEPNEVQVIASLGKGELEASRPGIDLLAEMLLPESGVGKLTKEQLKAALAAYSSNVHFRAEQDSFQFRGKGLKDESELLFQLLYTKIYDPAFRTDAFARGMQKLRQTYARLESSVDGMIQLQGERFLAGGNLRYGVVPLEMVEKISSAEVEEWLRPILKNAGLELSVVGDFDPQKILDLAGQYFGSQPRERIQPVSGEQIAFPSGKSLSLAVDTDSDKGLIMVAWPTEDFWKISRTRRLSILASVLDDRLRKQVREELGAAYSPYVYNWSSTVDPGYGVLRSVVTVDPAQAAALIEKVKQAGTQLAEGKVTEEELQRALEPTLTYIRDTVRTNGYWLQSVLLGSSRYPQRLEWPKTFLNDYAAITAEDVSALAAQYLQPEKAAEIILLPKKNAYQNAEQKAEQK